MRKPFIIFLVLALYIVLQFSWWAYLIYDQGQMLNMAAQGHLLEKAGRNHLRMILSEGTVFLVIVSFLLLLAYRTFKRELGLVRSKDNFLMAVTHELRTPIAGMQLSMQTLQRAGLDDKQRERLISNAISDTKRLKDLSDRVLLAAQSENESLSPNKTEVDISALAARLVQKCKTELGKEHRIESTLGESLVVETDETAFSTILINLLENAIKYSPKNSLIAVSLSAKSGTVELTVADNGPGISKEDKNRIFDKFHRSGNEMTRNTKGTGLGLFIVKRFAEDLGGSVQVSDNSPKGSIFTVSLPTQAHT